MKTRHYNKTVIQKSLSILVLLSVFVNSYSQKTQTLMSLKGKWWFMIVDKEAKDIPAPQSDMWEVIDVPGNWESQGYNGYDGYAWYKKVITIPEDYKNKSLGLELGYIDDVDEVYVNGKLLGFSGSFPPAFTSAYNAKREYNLPGEYIKYGQKNIITVRIFDSWGEGGIVKGDVRIFEYLNRFPIDIDLQGIWLFKTGDNPDWKNQTIDETKWKNIVVPANWENQGYKDLDGFAWYRKTFKVSKELATKDLVLIAGKIDDLDQTYLNGKLIGNIGEFYNDVRLMITQEELGPDYERYRIYEIPKDALNTNGTNIIAIRVYDVYGLGGIYQGPVGIISKETYLKYRKEKKLK